MNEHIDGASPVFSVACAAKFLRVSESIVRRLIRENRIPFFKIEGRYLLYQPALEEWIQTQIVQPTGTPGGLIAQGIADDIWNGKERRK